MSTPKGIDFEVIITEDGRLASNVTARQEGADCRAVKRIAQRMGQVESEQQTGPFCNTVREKN